MIGTMAKYTRPDIIVSAFALLLVFVLLLGGMTPSVARAHDPILYSVSPFNNAFGDAELRTINPNTAATISSIPITMPGKTVLGANGLAQDPTTGTLWAILKISGQSGRDLVTLNPATGVATSIGNTGDSFAGITFATDGTLYGVTGDGGSTPETLFTLDKSNGTPTLVLALGNGADGETIAFNPDDGLIYHASGFDDPIFETINPTTLAVTDVPLTGVGFHEALSLVDNGPSFLLTDLFSLLLYDVTDDGVVSVVGTMDHVAKGLAFLEHDHPVAVGGTTTFLAGGSGTSPSEFALLAGGVGAVLALTAGGWYTRKRWLGNCS